MLPFKKKDQSIAGIIMKTRSPDKKPDDMPEDDSYDYEGLEATMDELSKASAMGDVKKMARAFKAAFEICDAAPHVEGPHLDEQEEV